MNTEHQTIKVILVDDHRIVRQGIRILLSMYADIEITGEARNGDELFEILPHLSAGVILLDISMPGLSGIEIARRLKKDYPDIAVIILTANTGEDNIYEAVRAGAKGFIPKDSGHTDIVTAIRKVQAGEEYFADSVAQTVLKAFVRMAREGGADTPGNERQEITPREKEIIIHIFEGLSYKEIGARLNISVRTVETHKNNIMKKLGLRSLADLMKYALRNNIVEF
ncbi:MAG: response regulator transcription factor [Bacteroidales bacterium]|nr:response regulator transcription factor [Bacteroidales bacterium]